MMMLINGDRVLITETSDPECNRVGRPLLDCMKNAALSHVSSGFAGGTGSVARGYNITGCTNIFPTSSVLWTPGWRFTGSFWSVQVHDVFNARRSCVMTELWLGRVLLAGQCGSYGAGSAELNSFGRTESSEGFCFFLILFYCGNQENQTVPTVPRVKHLPVKVFGSVWDVAEVAEAGWTLIDTSPTFQRIMRGDNTRDESASLDGTKLENRRRFERGGLRPGGANSRATKTQRFMYLTVSISETTVKKWLQERKLETVMKVLQRSVTLRSENMMENTRTHVIPASKIHSCSLDWFWFCFVNTEQKKQLLLKFCKLVVKHESEEE